MHCVLPSFLIFFSLLFTHAASANPTQTLSLQEFSNIVSQNKGKVVFVTIFSTWCPACREDLPNIIKAYKQYTGKPIVFIGLSVDSDPQKLTNYINDQKIEFPVYTAGKNLITTFNISAIPHTIVYNKNGNIIFNKASVLSTEEITVMLDKNI